MCPQVLSATSVGSPSQLFVFGLGLGGELLYRIGTKVGWTGAWVSAGSSIAGQPSAITWYNNQKLSLFAVSSPKRNVLTKTYSGGVWSDWEDIGGSIAGRLSLCRMNWTTPGVIYDRIDVWGTDSNSGVDQKNWYNPAVGDYRAPAEQPAWESTNLQLASSPAISCRNEDNVHDVVAFAKGTRALEVNQYSISKLAWRGWVNRGGNFLADPVILETGNRRFDVFAIGSDFSMYYFSWINDVYLPLESIGGSFQSVPSVVISKGSVERIDVLALGTDDMLKHRAMNVTGSKWTTGWEDLGVFGNSAPLVTNLGNGTLGIFVIGLKGEVNYTSWAVSDIPSWSGLRWTSLGGNMTMTGYTGV